VRARLKELAQDPRDMRLSKPLKADPKLRSSRVGEWRVLYNSEESEKVLYVAIRPPRKGYRHL